MKPAALPIQEKLQLAQKTWIALLDREHIKKNYLRSLEKTVE